MNLARFELLKDDDGKIIPDGTPVLVEVSEREALASSVDTHKVESLEEVFHLAKSLNILSFKGPSARFAASFLPASGQRALDKPIPPRRKRKYVKREKKTSKEFVEKMKTKYGLLDLDSPVDEMGPKELLRYFPKSSGEEVDKNLFARNVVWSFYRRILAGQPPDFVKEGCNMRTIFYLMKNVFTQNRVFDGIDSFYGNFSKAVKTLVLAGLISYKDFNIMDDRKVYRFLPTAEFNTHIILLAEKKSAVGRFTALANKYQVVSQITTGRSTLVMTDTMLTEMFELGYDLNKNLTILSYCDFDPVGTSIPFHFVKHLNDLGFYSVNEFTQYGDKTMRRQTGTRKGKPIYKTITQRRPCLDIINPHDFDSDTRNAMRHELKASLRDDPSTADWAFITGGVTGTGLNKKYAITAEQFLPYVNDQLDEKIRPFLSLPPEEVGRQYLYKAIHKALQEYSGARLQLDD